MKRKERYNQKILQFIINHVFEHPRNIASLVGEHFQVTRTTANRYLKRLLARRVLVAKGLTKAREYQLQTFLNQSFIFRTAHLQEYEVWRMKLFPLIQELKKNVIDICQFAVTEMVNNVVDHSGSAAVKITIKRNAKYVEFIIIY